MILVTGGGGFLGRAIVERLLARGETVRSLQRSPQPELAARGVQVIQADLGDAEAVAAACAGCESVFHVAAKAGVWGRFLDYHRANVLGTQHVLAGCRQAGVRRLLYTSSPSVVFDGTDENGIDESAPYPRRHLNAYSATKARAEAAVLAANDDMLATVALRPHLIWGPGDPHLLPRLWQRARAGRLQLIRTPEPKLVDATYIDNAADAHIAAWLALAEHGRPAGRAYFIGNDEPLPMNELVNALLAADGLPPVQPRVPPTLALAVGTVLEYGYRLLRLRSEPRLTRFVARQLSTAHWFSLAAAKRDFGYTPAIPISEGLQRLARSRTSEP